MTMAGGGRKSQGGGASKTSSPLASLLAYTSVFGRDELAVAFVYFVQGVIGLSSLATTFYLKDSLKLDPAEVATVMGTQTLPWLIKPLYGFLSDSVPLFGYRRKSYLTLCGVLGAACWVVVWAADQPSVSLLLTCTTISSATIAMSDVIVDSMVVTLARDEDPGTAGALQSLCWGSRAIGAISSSFFAGSLVERFGPQFVFGLTAVLPMFTALAGGLSTEQRVAAPFGISGGDQSRAASAGDGSQSILTAFKHQSVMLWDAVKLPSIYLPTAFMFIWRASPTASTAMFFYFTEELNFSPEFIGQVRFVSSFASLAGVAFYNVYLKRTPLKKIYFWSSITGTVLGLSQLLLITGVSRHVGLDDKIFAVGDEVILSVLTEIAFLPSLVLAAKICPEGVEASLFAAMMSIFNAGMVFSQYLGGVLTKSLGVTGSDFSNLWLLVLICNLSQLFPLLFLSLVPDEKELASDKRDKEK